MFQGFNPISGFLYHIVLAKLAVSSIRVKTRPSDLTFLVGLQTLDAKHSLEALPWQRYKLIMYTSGLYSKIGLKKVWFVSCNPTLTSFYSKISLPQSFFCLSNSQSTKYIFSTRCRRGSSCGCRYTCIKHTFLNKK